MGRSLATSGRFAGHTTIDKASPGDPELPFAGLLSDFLIANCAQDVSKPHEPVA
jgi:hypothetical protein